MNKKYLNPLNKIHKFHETIRAREGVGRLLLSRARSKSDCRGRPPRRSLEEKTNLGWGPNERANGSYLSVRPPHCSALLRCPLLPLGTTTTALRSGVICPAPSAPRPTHASVTCLSSFPPSLLPPSFLSAARRSSIYSRCLRILRRGR